MSDRAVTLAGERIAIRAWITDVHGQAANTAPLTLEWTASHGTISGTANATWVLPSDLPTKETERVSARLNVRGEGFGEAACEVVVFVPTVGEAHEKRFSNLLEVRALLRTGKSEPPGYGLYSYLLFRSPPTDDEERRRYLNALEAWLRIAPVEELLALYRRPSSLNLTLVPVNRGVDLPKNLSDPEQVAKSARRLLDAYDYSHAQVLLTSLGEGSADHGPYLMSRTPASATEPVPPLLIDMSGITPRLVADWVEAYCRLAAQEPQGRKWTRVALTKFNLNMRNVVAVMAADLPTVLNSVERIVRVLDPKR